MVLPPAMGAAQRYRMRLEIQPPESLTNFVSSHPTIRASVWQSLADLGLDVVLVAVTLPCSGRSTLASH